VDGERYALGRPVGVAVDREALCSSRTTLAMPFCAWRRPSQSSDYPRAVRTVAAPVGTRAP